MSILAAGRYTRAAGATQGTLEVVLGGCPGLQPDLDALRAELAALPEE